jgi:hypothetical protein
MGKQIFDKFIKSLAILLVVFLVASVTIGAASAKASNSNKNNGNSGSDNSNDNSVSGNNNNGNSGSDNSNVNPGKIWNKNWNKGYNKGHRLGENDANDGNDPTYQDDGNAEFDEESTAVDNFNNGNIDQDQLKAQANNDGIEDGYLDGYNGN